MRGQAHCVAGMSGNHAVAGSVLPRAKSVTRRLDLDKVVATGGSGDHNGLQPRMGYQHCQGPPTFHHPLLHHHRLATLEARTMFRGHWW